jgi:hypothetical protein
MLRVADEHAGKPLRCPVCNHISTAPSAAASVAASPPADWHMRTPEGQTYGPVTRDELDRWVAQGRISVDCQLAQSPTGPWEPAPAIFPALMLLAPKPAPPQPAPAFQPASPFSGNPYAAAPGTAGQYVTPHRGGLILVLGLVGIVMGCPIFSLMAWVMGSGDLREMRAGRMDRSGEGLTQAGQILGMIPSILFIFGAALFMLIIIVAAVAGR